MCLHGGVIVSIVLFHADVRVVCIRLSSSTPPPFIGSASLVAIPYKDAGFFPSSIRASSSFLCLKVTCYILTPSPGVSPSDLPAAPLQLCMCYVFSGLEVLLLQCKDSGALLLSPAVVL